MEFEGGAGTEEPVFAAGVCSDGVGDEEIEIRRYAIALLLGFFRQKGRDLKLADYRLALNRIFRHLHQHITEEWREREEGLDLALVIANASRAYAARRGIGDLFLFREGEARSLFQKEDGDSSLLGTGNWEEMELDEASLQPGDIVVLCNPAVARVIKARDITLILRRASELPKAGLFLSAIAERKGATGPLTALLWEVPNYQGAAMLTEETPPGAKGGPGEAEGERTGELDHAELAKKHWLSLWKHRKS